MTRFQDVTEFVLFLASILKMRFTFCLIAQNIHQLETTCFDKIDNRIPNYKHIPISTLIVSITKFLIVIGSPRAYLSRNRRAITWVSNYRCPIWTFCNRPRSIYQYSNMAPRLSGQNSIFGVVFFVSKSLLGIEKQKKLEKFAILTRKPRSHARILIYRTWPIGYL